MARPVNAVSESEDRSSKAIKASATWHRFWTSCHVRDLRLIFGIAVVFLLFAVVAAAILGFEAPLVKDESRFTVFLKMFGAIVGAVATLAVPAAAWAYQAASARLGVVDLFACEIVTLCRVAAVTDTAKRFVEAYGKHNIDFGHFTSKEEYFPVFGKTVKDLQSLEAVVLQHITTFYTCMKTMRDYLRKLPSTAPDAGTPGDVERYQALIFNIIYMMFLGFESARRSMTYLVEYQPTQAECQVAILLSELTLFKCLKDKLEKDKDFRWKRLDHRASNYNTIGRYLYEKIDDNKDRSDEEKLDWKNAQMLLEELEIRYKAAFGAPIPHRPNRQNA